MEDFKEFHLNKEWLEMYNLPDIGYPVPVSQLNELSQSGGKIDLKALLHWLQEYSTLHADKWLSLETAIFRLALLLAPEDKERQIRVYGDNWFLVCGAVNLEQKIISIQRQDHLIAAISPLDNGLLCVCSYRPLDAGTARYLIDLSQTIDSDSGKSSWEFVLERVLEETKSNVKEKGEAYLKFWELGLGVSSEGNFEEPWFSEYESASIPYNLCAM